MVTKLFLDGKSITQKKLKSILGVGAVDNYIDWGQNLYFNDPVADNSWVTPKGVVTAKFY